MIMTIIYCHKVKKKHINFGWKIVLNTAKLIISNTNGILYLVYSWALLMISFTLLVFIHENTTFNKLCVWWIVGVDCKTEGSEDSEANEIMKKWDRVSSSYANMWTGSYKAMQRRSKAAEAREGGGKWYDWCMKKEKHQCSTVFSKLNIFKLLPSPCVSPPSPLTALLPSCTKKHSS